MSDNRLSIGKAAEMSGLNVETIRFYEKEGLVPEPGRTEGGHRLYSKNHVARLVFIRRSRKLGFSMTQVRQILSLVDREQVSCEAVKSIADDHIDDIRARIADLRKMERTLNELSRRCSGKDIPDCPIIDALQPR